MKDFAGKIAVITGGGTGMGRELARQLVAEGCNVAMCDVSAENMAETKRLCEVEKLPQGLRVTTHVADVSIEDQLKRFRDELIDHALQRWIVEHTPPRGRHVVVGDAEGQVRPRHFLAACLDLVEALERALVHVMPVDPHEREAVVGLEDLVLRPDLVEQR